ncbi:MAG: beta strand repeat-containing protein [Pirellulales bacterium]
MLRREFSGSARRGSGRRQCIAAGFQPARRLRLEPLEARTVLAAVSWDGGGDGSNWSDPLNWSGNALPTSADDVTINVVGTITVTHSTGTTTIRSLTSDEHFSITGGSLTVSTGASNVNGNFSISNLATLIASGATATFTANAAATIDGSNLTATGGGQLNLVTATSYAQEPSQTTTIQATGTGSKIDLSGVTALTGTTGGVNIQAINGGTIELDSLPTTTARDINFYVSGVGGTLNLTALTSASDTTGLGSLQLDSGGTLIAPSLATYSYGNLYVDNMSATLTSLTNVDGSDLNAYNGTLSLPNVTSYSTAGTSPLFYSNAGGKIELNGLTSITGTGNLWTWIYTGATLEMTNLTSIAGSPTFFLFGGTIDVSSLVAMNGVGVQLYDATGSLIAPLLTNIDGSSLSVSNGGTLALPNVTSIDGSSLSVSNGGTLALPNATSYSWPSGTFPSLYASGAGSKLDLSAITSITGPGDFYSLSVGAGSGGTVELDSLPSLTAATVFFSTTGTGSVLDLSALTGVSDPTLNSGLFFESGGALVAPLLTNYNGGTISVESQSVSLSQLTNIDGSRLVADANGILTLPNVTSYTVPASGFALFEADGANAKLDLTSITSITNTTGSVDINALAGGTIELDGLATLAARDIDLQSDGPGSTLNLSALTSASDSTLTSSLLIENGGTLTAPLWTTYNGGIITVNNQSATLSSFTNIDNSNLTAGANGILTLPNLASYTLPASGSKTFLATGAGSKLDLTALTSLTGASGSLNVLATSGGTIELDGLPSTTARDLNFETDGAASTLNLSALTSINDSTSLGNLLIENGGTLTAPLWTTYNGGTITVNNQSASLANFTNLDNSSLFAGANGILTLPNLASYVLPASGTKSFQASGAGSKLDLTALTSITGTTGGLDVNALSGGTIELDGLASTTARDIDFEVDGATSTLNLSALTSINDSTALGTLLIENNGTLVAPLWSTYNGGTVTVNNQSVSLANFTNLDNSSLTAGANGVLTLPNLASYALPASGSKAFQASGAGSKLDLTALTSITGTTGGLDVNALSGGTIELDGLPSTTARDIDLQANGATSLLVASALATWSDSTNLSSLTATSGGSVNLTAGTAALTGVSVSIPSGGIVNVGTLQLNTNSPISGSGTLNGHLTANNFVRPGTSPGRLTVNGDYAQTATGTLAIELTGLAPATQYDQLAVNGGLSLGGTLTVTRTFEPVAGDSFTIIENDGADPVVGTFIGKPEGAVFYVSSLPLRISYTGGDGNDVVLTRVPNFVAGRHLFYNQSAFDLNSAANNSFDDLAIATDKTAYLPGAGLAVYSNISNYSRGINGILIDIGGTGSHTSINANDFVFKVGANNAPGTWANAPAPLAVSVRTGAGVGGSDRVDITWANAVIKNQWLLVAVKDTANTGLAATGTVFDPASAGNVAVADIFFYGNRIGDTGSPTATAFTTTVSDASAVVGGGLGSAGGITNVRDIDRSNTITVAGDQAAVISNFGALNRLNVGTAGPFAPEEGDAGIASSLAAAPTAAPLRALPPAIARRYERGHQNAGHSAAYFRQLTEGDAPRFGSLATQADLIDDLLELDDELVTVLAGNGVRNHSFSGS